jgi:hypothetical protein
MRRSGDTLQRPSGLPSQFRMTIIICYFERISRIRL